MWIKMDPLDYACMKIRRFEKRFGLKLGIDWVEYAPHSILNDYGGYYLDNITGERIIFIPRIRDKKDFDEFLFHEIGHAVFGTLGIYYLQENRCVGKDVMYYFRSLFGAIGKRKEGYCSRYSEVNMEEEFCELLSFVLINQRRKRFYKFNGEVIDLLSDKVLLKKVRWFEKLLWR